MKHKDAVHRLFALNAECFGEDDTYSDIDTILRTLHFEDGQYWFVNVDGQPVGYLLVIEHKDHIEGVRLGVTESHRGAGVGRSLVKKALKFAAERGKPYRTYTSLDNLTSANLHIRAGMHLSAVDKWIHLTYQP